MTEMTSAQAQYDMRRAFAGGGPGAAVSAIVWAVAAWVLSRHGASAGFAALFVGGLFIFPAGLLVVRALRRPVSSPTNPLRWLGLESTVAMIAGFLGAWLLLPHAPDATFPVAAIAVGAHYAAFRTLYGEMLYVPFAAVLMLLGTASLFAGLPPVTMAAAVAVVEAVFAALLTRRAWKLA